MKPYSGSTMSIALLMKAAAMPMPPRSGDRSRMMKCRALVRRVLRKYQTQAKAVMP